MRTTLRRHCEMLLVLKKPQRIRTKYRKRALLLSVPVSSPEQRPAVDEERLPVEQLDYKKNCMK